MLSKSAAAAAKSLQSCPTLCDPIDGSSPGSSIPRILQARVLEWGAIAFSDPSLDIVKLSILGKRMVCLLLSTYAKMY